MAEKSSLNAYTAYKVGTYKLVDWLTTTATKTCPLSPTVMVLQDKRNKAIAAANRVNAQPEDVLVTTHEMLELAKVIKAADMKPTGNILRLFQSVIDGRADYANNFGQKSLAETGHLSRSDNTYRYFISVLERVRNLLIDGASSSDPSKTATLRTKGSWLTNLYLCLEVEEPTQDSSASAPAPEQSPSQPVVIPEVRFKLEEEQDNVDIAVWCFIEELHDAHNAVQSAWEECRRGEISAITAGILSDYAFGLIRRANDELTAAFPKFDSFMALNQHLLKKDSWMREDVVENEAATVTTTLANFAGISPEFEGLISKPALDMLTNFAEDCKKTRNPLADVETSGEDFNPFNCSEEDFNPIKLSEADLSSFSWCERDLSIIADKPSLHPFQKSLQKLLLALPHYLTTDEYSGVLRGNTNSAGDEFIAGLIRLGADGKVETWLVAAAQMNMDLFETFGDIPNPGCDIIEEELDRIETVTNQHRSLRTPYLDDNLHSYVLDLGDCGTEEKKIIRQAVSNQPHHKAYKGSDLDLWLTSCFPVQAAWRVYWSTSVPLYNYGIQFANQLMAVHVMAHLYSAARNYRIIGRRTKWPAMDAFMKHHDVDVSLLTSWTPDMPNNYLMANHFRLSLGASLSALDGVDGNGKKRKRTPFSTLASKSTKVRKIKGVSPHAELSRQDNPGFDFDRHEDRLNATTDMLRKLATRKENKVERNDNRDAAQYPTCHLLATLRSTLAAHEAELKLDYVGLWELSLKILHHVYFDLKRDLPLSVQRSNGPDIAQMVDHLLWNAAETRDAKRSISDALIYRAKPIFTAALERLQTNSPVSSAVSRFGSRLTRPRKADVGSGGATAGSCGVLSVDEILGFGRR